VEIIYGERRDGVALPRRITSCRERMARVDTLEIESIAFGPVPERNFTLPAFGLPELDASPTPKRESRLGILLICASAATLIVAVGLNYFARRARGER